MAIQTRQGLIPDAVRRAEDVLSDVKRERSVHPPVRIRLGAAVKTCVSKSRCWRRSIWTHLIAFVRFDDVKGAFYSDNVGYAHRR